jgi:hypothetical protein
LADSPDGYYLAAYCINATSLASVEVEWIVVFKDLDGQWVDRDGNVVWPFHVQPITQPLPPVPADWIEYLHAEAIRYATSHASPKADLLSALGIHRPPSQKIDRRI